MLWRLRGPGHRACAVSHADDGITVWAFLSEEHKAPDEPARLWLGLEADATKQNLPRPDVSWERVEDWDWPEPIKRQLVPRDIGRRLTVLPPGTTQADANRLPIHLDGRFGFGVGGIHPTTRLCLEALERHLEGDATGLEIADIGCGAGTLSIAAISLGVKHVVAVDTKSAAVFGTRQNRELNGIDPSRLVVLQGSVSEVGTRITAPVDGFVCNILTRIIAYLIPRFDGISGPHTWGILSGIREAELEVIEGPLCEHGWRTTNRTQNAGWCCLEIVRNNG